MMTTQRYQVLAAAFLAGAGLCTGAVIYRDPADIPIPANFGGVYLDFNTDAINGATEGGAGSADEYTVSFSEPGDWDVNLFFGGTGIVHNTTFQPYRGDASDNLSPVHNVGLNSNVDGNAIGASAPLTTPDFGGSGTATGGGLDGSLSATHMGLGTSQFESGTLGYIGFVLDPGTASEWYGWMEVTLNDDGNAGAIHRWAFTDDPAHDPILVGVPEPGTAMLALLGAFGLVARRRR